MSAPSGSAPAPDATPAALPAGQAAWIGACTGGQLLRAVRQPGGGRKEAWFVDVEVDGEVHELFLRLDRTHASPADPWTLARESQVYLALQGSPVPVPRVFGISPDGHALLAERIHGQNSFSHITDPETRRRVAEQFIDSLAAQHRLDPRSLDISAFPEPSDVAAMTRQELAEVRSALDARGGDVDPALAFALGWLGANVPATESPVVLVQGDTGPGNFLYDGDRLLAVVDWELAHFGDPMDDIAWLTLRATQEALPDLPGLLRRYASASGHRIDGNRVNYYRLLAETKLQVMSHHPQGLLAPMAVVDGSGPDLGNALIYRMLHRRLWFEALGEALGVAEPKVERPPIQGGAADPPGFYASLSALVLEHLRDIVVPHIGDPFGVARAKGLARAIKHLAALHIDGPFYEAQELEDLAGVLGARFSSLSQGRAALADAARVGTVAAETYVTCLWRRVIRENELMRSASGVLADRHWPALA